MMSTPTKLGALAANSLREKRRSPRSSYDEVGASSNHHEAQPTMDDAAAPSDQLEVSMAEESQAGASTISSGSGAGNNRSNVHSFFDPQEIRKPPTSPASSSCSRGRGQSRPFDEPSGEGSSSAGAGGGDARGERGDRLDDAGSRCSNGSAATERICNHKVASAAAAVASAISSAPSNSSAAAAAASVRPSSSTWINEEREVKYEEGASELFMLVEDAKWEEVCERVEEEPTEARVWVVSSGTENTVFSWSVWRRLPLHEACRRQPPPVVIYALLSAYPESSMAESNFGELPLHAAVRCGACAEVVNCILASYPAAVLARDNSGCTPLDILNGTGKMMDHDAVVGALNRTIAVLTKEEQSWEDKISTMQHDFKQSKEKRRREYERIVANKNAEIEDLNRALDQEKLATSNLASKVIQTEQVVQDKGKLEKRYIEKIRKLDEEIRDLKGSNSSRKGKIKELEETVRSDRKAILELNNRVQTLQSALTSLLEDEEAFAATKLTRAEKNFKTLMESQFVFLRETERRKDLLRSRVKQLGIKIPAKKKPGSSPTVEEEEKTIKAQQMQPVTPVEEVSNNEVADRALASAMAHLTPYIEDHDEMDRED